MSSSPYWFLLGEGKVTVGSGLVDGDGAALWKEDVIYLDVFLLCSHIALTFGYNSH